MKNLLLLLIAIFGLVITLPVTIQAEEGADDVAHYEGKEFQSKKEAMQALTETSTKMAMIAAEETLDVAKMEEIHEISYTTENAVGYLNKKSQLDELAVKLEEVHLSSEDHSADDLRRNYIIYQAELTNYLAKN